MERFDDTMSEKYINTPVTEQDIESLETGDMVYISGTIYTARDAAHKSYCRIKSSICFP